MPCADLSHRCPLGILQRDMSTTTKATIRKPDSHTAFAVARARPSGPRFGMVTEETFDEAMLA